MPARSLSKGSRSLPFTLHVIMNSVLLRDQVQPQLERLAAVLAVSLLLSILLAVVASNVAFRPLARIGDIIDRIARGEEAAALPRRQAKEVAAVESKLDLLGKQFRGAQASALELRANIDQLLDRMEDAVLLFGRDNRLMMAGSGAERLLGSGRWVMMGKTLEEIFPGETVLGAVVQSAVHLRREVKDQPIELEREGMPSVRLLVTVELIEDFPRHERLGTLLRLRDADPRRQIESQLDISTRLAAISELTSGAAHEIKNPLNSIALHLEILKSKLDGIAPGGEEIEVITREIARLDRVVKTFLDFQRPVELQLGSVDLVALVKDVAGLVRPTAQAPGRSDPGGDSAVRSRHSRRPRPAQAGAAQRGDQRGGSHEGGRLDGDQRPADPGRLGHHGQGPGHRVSRRSCATRSTSSTSRPREKGQVSGWR